MNATKKMNCLRAQRLSHVQLGRPHIASSITYQQLIDPFGFSGNVNSLVVNLDFFAWLQIIVYDHLATSANQRTPYFNGRQPINMNMSHERAVKKESQVSNIFRLPSYMTYSNGR